MIKSRYKKFLPALAIALAGSFCGMNAYAETPAQQSGFADENFYKCIVRKLGVEEGTVLTQAQLDTIDILTCDNSGAVDSEKINNIDGIAQLTNLTNFYLVSTNVEYADLTSNRKIIGTSFIDTNLRNGINVSGNNDLVNLTISNSEISSIDVANTPNLMVLDINNAKITSLNVTNNPYLTHLEVRNTKITSIDLTHNGRLEYLDLSNNKISSLDTSILTNLLVLYINSTKISNLDVSNNQKLEKLDIGFNTIANIDLSHNQKLSTLSSDHTLLTSLDLTHNPLLRNLDASYSSRLSSLNLTNNKALQDVSLNGTAINTIDIPSNELRSLQFNNTKVAKVNLSNYPELVFLRFDNTNIKSIDISNNTKLSYLSAQNAKLTRLNVSNNPLLAYLNVDDIYVFNSATTDDNNKRNFDLSPLHFLITYNYEGDDSFVWNNPANTIDIVDYDAFAGYIRMTKINPYKLVLFSSKIPKEEQEESDDSKTSETPVVNPNTMDDAQLIALASVPFFAIVAFGYHKLAKRR